MTDADAAEAALRRHIRELVDRAPPLTPEQRDRLAVLLRQRPTTDNEQTGTAA